MMCMLRCGMSCRRSFLSENAAVLNWGTTTALLEGYGRLGELEGFAAAKGDQEALLEYLMRNKDGATRWVILFPCDYRLACVLCTKQAGVAGAVKNAAQHCSHCCLPLRLLLFSSSKIVVETLLGVNPPVSWRRCLQAAMRLRNDMNVCCVTTTQSGQQHEQGHHVMFCCLCCRALGVLRKPSVGPQLVYKFAPELLAAAPQETVDFLIAAGSTLDPRQLLPALVRFGEPGTPAAKREQALRYASFALDHLRCNDRCGLE